MFKVCVWGGEGGSILRGNLLSFTKIFFLFKHSPYFLITPCMVNIRVFREEGTTSMFNITAL